ncbi:hypothetical protein D0962_28380 [Leptolyngbyaceae cyanobacterium CCMR0082]|uniref:Apea-like HEPN domain-containing protein n=1 Tax=Adonisia turfae CCMR0082 TaxID=2304604 RepID=A0A6M0SDR1_9CYAN|nr:hypothetical protein [Adonisia turfae]NEZ66630.1 hypothetical protein [Adonisia turfae CCMR0082]
MYPHPLTAQFEEFYRRWLTKAQQYDAAEPEELFDKFFSLYVVYNALYTKTATYLHNKAVREGTEEYQLDPNGSFPDRQAATRYVCQLLKSSSLMQSLESSSETSRALKELKAIVAEQHFRICLNPVTGEWEQERDLQLVSMLESNSKDENARAILQVIYQIRCNMFHGRKDIQPIQQKILVPLIIIFEKVIKKLFLKIEQVYQEFSW